MREQQRNPKSASPLSRYRPALDTLEDRSMPGNALIGLSGFSLPFAVTSAQKALTSSISRAANPAAVKAVQAAQAAAIAPSANTASSSGGAAKQALQASVSSSSTAQIQGGNGGTSMTFSSATLDSWQSILTQAVSNNYTPSVSGASAPVVSGASTSSFVAPMAAGSSAPAAATTKASQPAYDAETQARLREYANDGAQGYLSNYATPDRAMSSTQLAAADALKATIPNLTYNTNTEFGTPTTIINTTGLLTGPKAGDPVTIARNYLSQISSFLGVNQSDLNSLSVVKNYGETVSGTKLNYVYFNQQVNGIPVFGGATSVSMKGDGSIGIVANGTIPNIVASVNTTTPVITATAAAQAVAQNLGLPVTKAIVQLTPGVGTQKKGTVSDGGFARQAITTELALMPTGNGSTRLAWHLSVFLKNDYLFDFYVDATNGDVLLRMSQTHFDSYKVMPTPVKAPNQGSFATLVNPADKVASPWGWHDTNGKTGSEYTITRGNNTAARARRDDSAPGSLGYLYPSGGTTNTYAFAANFNNDPRTYQAAAAVQLFYAVNTWHDVSYRYGFTEAAGNAQQNNYGRGGIPSGANDAVQAFAQDNADQGVADNAFMVTPPDGIQPEVHMFVWDFTGPNRDGDFDSEVVFHELGHGLVGRLVNGGGTFGSIMSGPQAGALHEGWADYDGLFFTTPDATKFNKATPSGTYVIGQPVNGLGIRRLPYSTDEEINPLTYNDFDPAQVDVQFPLNPPIFAAFGPVDESHNGGEIWTNALWELEARMVGKYGFSTNIATGTAGNNRTYQMVISGMKMTPPFPSMLDARDATVAAQNMIYGGADLAEVWGGFSDSGMGVHANPGIFDLDADDPGWQSAGIIEDFTMPDGLVDPGVPTNPTDPNDPGGVGGNGSEDALYEPNETANKAYNLGAVTGKKDVNNLQIKQNLAGQAADRDWFKFTPTKAGTLTLTMTPNTNAGDLDVRLYRSTNGSPNSLTEIGITQGTHRVAGGVETITVVVGAGITYYFNTAGFNGGLGNYNLTLNTPS